MTNTHLAQIGRGTIYPFIDFTTNPTQVLINLFLGGTAYVLVAFSFFKLLLICTLRKPKNEIKID